MMEKSTYHQYSEKAAFFDDQVESDWAVAPYDSGELEKLERIFAITGPLRGVRVLEPGCGTGRLTEVIAEKVGPEGIVVAMDISQAMVTATWRRLSGVSNVTVLLGPVEETLCFASYFDLVLCHQVFPHFEDQFFALSRLTDMLVSEGRLIISHFIPREEINDVHRKSGTAVAADMMPPLTIMQDWCDRSGLQIEQFNDGTKGYLLSAKRKQAQDRIRQTQQKMSWR